MSTPIDQLAVLPPCDQAIGLLREDKHFLLVDKPAGLLSVPGRHPDNDDCVLSRLERNYPGASIIHRLDFDTSGVMVVALNKKAHGAIARQFQERETYKRYTAHVSGALAEHHGEIDLPIAPDQDNRPKYKICPETGKPSLTRYRVDHYWQVSDTSQVTLEPATGRSHQLRLHLAAIGHPILGCAFYAPDTIRSSAERLRLHATELRFRHPVTGEQVSVISPCPF